MKEGGGGGGVVGGEIRGWLNQLEAPIKRRPRMFVRTNTLIWHAFIGVGGVGGLCVSCSK